MHGCNSGSALLVNAEVDSMGGVVDGGVGIGLKTSPRRAAIEKAQAELRQEYDVREERRRELEFLEKGGNPLDFKFGNAASVSVQSTSLTDQHHEQLVTSEAKGSFALTASPHCDSVDSSARPGAPSVSEPNTADNLLLFDGANELPEGEKRSVHSNKINNFAPSEQSSQIAKETEDSGIFRPISYARRFRSRPNHGSRGGSRDGKGLLSDTKKQKEHNMPSVSKPKPGSANGEMLTNQTSNNPLDKELFSLQPHQTTSGNASVPEDKLDITLNRNLKDNQHILHSHDDTLKNVTVLASGEADVVEEKDPGASADLEPLPPVATTQPGNESCSSQPNGFGNVKVDKKGVAIECQNDNDSFGMKNLDSASCTQTSLARVVHNDSDLYSNTKNVEANGNTMDQTSEFETKPNSSSYEVLKEKNKINAGESGTAGTIDHATSCFQTYSGTGNNDNSCLQNKVNDSFNINGVLDSDGTISKVYNEENAVLVDHSSSIKESSCGRHQFPLDVSISETPQSDSAEKLTTVRSSCQPSSMHHFKLADKAHEDSILEEARMIEVKRKRIAELSIRTLPTQNYQKSHWGFVLEEMAWLANDFAQERLWKMTAAAQLCHRASFTSRLRFEKQNKHMELKILSHGMSKAVMEFWHSVELLLDNEDPDDNCIGGLLESGKVDSNEASGGKRRNSVMETSKYFKEHNPTKKAALKVHAYALRFLKDSRSHGISSHAQAPATPDKIFDSGTVDMSWEDNLTEESLFYAIPPSAMESYRKSIESNFLQCEKTVNSIQEEVETSMYDTAADFGSEEIAYDENEGETSTYYLPSVYEGSRPSKSVQKKHKYRMKSYTNRPSEVGTDLPYVHYTTGTQPSTLFGKRPGTSHVGAIPTKRMRTASRQRVVSPFTMVSGTVQTQAKTDASSGDTNSFQDDQSTLNVSQIQKSVEVESVRGFEKQLPHDCAETSVKTKKKKPKNPGSAYDLGWQLDSVVLTEQREQSKKRLDSHHFDSNGSGGLYGQHNVKKPKMMKQSHDNNFDNISPVTNSIPSPAASQMSNMSNPSKIIKIISGRDRGRKPKTPKVSAGQPGSGSPWSLFEDQALVVLVHDMGPNWELVSDAINSTLQFKCIFRKPKECKERHKILMDRSAGDGADSAEDSGSSHSYPSTLPGIPKGSARQLFQRLQGPMEEDTLKSHFDKIIKIGQKHHYPRNQNDNQDLKQLVPVHKSHMVSLSKICPNNLNGAVLSPLDLCDANATSPDVLSSGYQGTQASGLSLSNHGPIPSSLPTSGPNSSITPSSGMGLGNNLSSPSGPMATSVRDSRYGVPRTSPLSVDEQQRIQQYNQMISGRSTQQSSMPVPGPLSGSDRGVRMLPGGNGMGIMSGINRSIAMPRPGFQGMGSPSMLSSGGMISSSAVGMPNPVNMNSGVGAGQSNSMLRPRETPNMIRSGHNQEHQRPMMVPELPLQVSQGVPAFSGVSSFNNQTNPPPVQPYPGHAQQPHQLSQQQSNLSNSHPLQGPNHATSSQQQAYAIRLAKERQLQQRYLQHQKQQQQFASSNALTSHAQPQSQLPMSSPVQNSPQAQMQNSSQQVSVTPSPPLTPMSSQPQPKHHLPQHGFSRNPGASGLTNQAVKQRQRQAQQRQYQQPGRQHPTQAQHVQSQQQAKLLKGIGRGNMVGHQNHSVDPSHLNGLSTLPGNQTVEKGDQIMQMMQGENLYTGSGLNPNPSSKPLGPAHSSNHSQLQQKQHSGPTNMSSKLLQPMASASDGNIQGQVLPVSSGHITSPPQPAVTASNHLQLQLPPQPQSKQIIQNRSSVQRMLQQNCQVHSESSSMSQPDLPKVDQQPLHSASQTSIGTTISQGCMDSAGVVNAVPTSSSQYKTSEPPFDCDMPNPTTQVSSLGSTAVGNSSGNEPPVISQRLGSQHLSDSLPSHIHNSRVHRQQQPLLHQQPSSSQPILSQQPYQPPEHQQQQEKASKDVALQHQPQQQVQHVQPGQNNLLIRSPNSGLE